MGYIISFTIVLLLLLYSFRLDKKLNRLNGSGRVVEIYRLQLYITLLHISASIITLITFFIYIN